MARPKRGEEKGLTAGIALRVTPEMRDEIRAMAAAEGKPISDLVAKAIEDMLKRWKRRGPKDSPSE